MSSRRSSRNSTSSRITVDDHNDHHQQHQINDLLFKLQTIVPELRRPRRPSSSSSNRVSASKTLQETCNYIRSLHKEVDDLSERLSEMLASMDTTTLEPEVLRSLLLLQQFNH